jgi:hypothetical protein
MSINLLPQKARFELERVRLIKKIKKSAALSAISFFVLFLFVLMANFYLQRETLSLSEQIAAAKTRVQGQKTTEVLLTLWQKRVRAIQEILKNRAEPGIKLWQVVSLLGSTVHLKDAEADNLGFKITLEAPSWQEMAIFRQNFPEEEIQKLGGKIITLSSLHREINGSYTAVLEIKNDKN